jgi:hypothetical protein
MTTLEITMATLEIASIKHKIAILRLILAEKEEQSAREEVRIAAFNMRKDTANLWWSLDCV